jgi:hypothetical protein
MQHPNEKLTQAEWTAIERPSPDRDVLFFLKEAFHAPDTVKSLQTVCQFLKMPHSPTLDDQLTEFLVTGQCPSNMKSANLIRLKNAVLPDELYEKQLLSALTALKRPRADQVQLVWTLHCLLLLNVVTPLQRLREKAMDAVAKAAVNPLAVVRRFASLESPKKTELRLYDHQRALFAVEPGLILYEAPTGTGKTLSPIGLAERGDVQLIVFLCGSRNVCLSLAQKCLTVGLRVAFALGSKTAADVRLHNSAAKTFAHRDERTGAKRGIDHLDGTLVQVAICDLPSAPALFDWLRLRPDYDPSKYVLYWDDSTAGLDRPDHPLQGPIRTMWEKNDIPFIVMASATLPDASLLAPMTEAYGRRFGLPVRTVRSTQGADATVQILDTDNFVAMPHHCCETDEERESAVRHLRAKPNLLRYVDLAVAVAALVSTDEALWEGRFPTLSHVGAAAIKDAYLEVVPLLKPADFRLKLHESTVQFMTADAHTITDPALFVADDLQKVVKFCLSFLNKSIVSALEANLRKNEEIKAKIVQLRKKLEDVMASDGLGEKKAAVHRLSPEAIQIEEQIQCTTLLTIELPKRYVPNSAEHQRLWAPPETKPLSEQPYTSDLDPGVAEKILETSVADEWKLLLLTGIGGFFKDAPSDYLEIVKTLAGDQRLYMILADTDYIYGTSYPFGHIYVGKDLADFTQSKFVQVCGRVGRYVGRGRSSVRLRDNLAIRKMFLPATSNIEAILMNEILL